MTNKSQALVNRNIERAQKDRKRKLNVKFVTELKLSIFKSRCRWGGSRIIKMEGGSYKYPPKAYHPGGVRGHAPPKKF